MSDYYFKTTTYSASFSLETLEKYLDSSFLSLLLKTLRVKSLSEANLHVDYVNNGLIFSHIEESK